MSRIAFSICGFVEGETPSLSPLVGWYLPVKGGADIVMTRPDTTNFPAPLSVEDSILLAWRSQELKLSYDVAVVIPQVDDIPDPNSSSVSGSVITDAYDTFNAVTVSDEQGLIPAGNIQFSGTDGIATQQLIIEGIVYDDLIYPQFILTIDIGPVGTPPLQDVATLQLYNPGPGYGDSGLVLTSDSIPSLNNLTLYAVSGQMWSGTVSLEINKYWEYDNGDEPIWDQTTGVQLISPIPIGL